MRNRFETFVHISKKTNPKIKRKKKQKKIQNKHKINKLFYISLQTFFTYLNFLYKN